MSELAALLRHTDPDVRLQGTELLRSLSPEEAGAVLSGLDDWDGLTLDGMALTQARFPRTLSAVCARGAALWGTSLRERTLSALQLHGSDLDGADLRNSRLRGVGLCNASLHGANLSGAHWSEIAAGGADFSRAEAQGLVLSDAALPLARLRRLDGAGLSAIGADLRCADFYEADLSSATLSGVDLRGADLRGAKLTGADLSFADLRGARLAGADLRGAVRDSALVDVPVPGAICLRPGADLSGRILAGQDLSGVDLQGADLRGADLRFADLEDMVLTGADMRGTLMQPPSAEARGFWGPPEQAEADLTGRDLRGAAVPRERLRGSYAMGFWIDAHTHGVPRELLLERGAVLVHAGWRPGRRPQTGWRSSLPPPWLLDAAAVPLVSGMWVWQQIGSGWVRRAESPLGALVDTAPGRLSRRIADLGDPATLDTALLWLALTLGWEHGAPESLRLRKTADAWEISVVAGARTWRAPLPITVPPEAGLPRCVAAAWAWWQASEKTTRGDGGMMLSNPWPPRHDPPRSPEDFLRQHHRRQAVDAEAVVAARRAAVVRLWAQRH